MSNGSNPTPRFGKPPVVEALMGVFFRPLEGFTLIRRVELWAASYKTRFPHAEERVATDEVREEFGDAFMAGPQIQVRWQTGPPSPRIWAKSPDSKHTIQIQNDAFFANWERDPDEPKPYLEYRTRKGEFEQNLRELERFLVDEKIGPLVPTSCFVNYVNHIPTSESTGFAELAGQLLTVWRNETSDDWLPPIETARLNFSFAMPDKRGRLHVTAAHAVRHHDQKPIVRLDLTARGQPPEETIEAALAWLDLGHEWVVRGFASLTTKEMHKEWERVL